MRWGTYAVALVVLMAAPGCEDHKIVSNASAKPAGARARARALRCPTRINFCGTLFPRNVGEITCYKGRGMNAKALSLQPLRCASKLRRLSIVSGELEFILPITIGDLSPLSHLKGLKTLELGHAKLTDTRALGRLVRLQKLSLHASRPVPVKLLKRLTRLRDLNLSSTSVADISALASLPALERLDLTSTKVKNLRPLRAMKNLRWLGLSATGTVSKGQREALRKRLPKLLIGQGASY